MRFKHLYIAILSLGMTIILGTFLRRPVCSWIYSDPGTSHINNGGRKYTLFVRANPQVLKYIQVYEGKTPSIIFILQQDQLSCTRLRYAHLVAEKRVSSSGITRFLLPSGDYYFLAIPAHFDTSESGLTVPGGEDVHLDNDLEIMAPFPHRLLPI